MTEIDEAIIRWTVRISMACYCGFLLMKASGLSRSQSLLRWIWTFGLACFLLHVLAAFELYHEWSHSHAYQHTADRTWEAVGWRWGGGIYFNYLLLFVWALDVGIWWCVGLDWPNRSGLYQMGLHGFFAFMVLNATVAFGPRGWTGVAVLMVASLTYLVWQRSRRSQKQSAS